MRRPDPILLPHELHRPRWGRAIRDGIGVLLLIWIVVAFLDSLIG